MEQWKIYNEYRSGGSARSAQSGNIVSLILNFPIYSVPVKYVIRSLCVISCSSLCFVWLFGVVFFFIDLLGFLGKWTSECVWLCVSFFCFLWMFVCVLVHCLVFFMFLLFSLKRVFRWVIILNVFTLNQAMTRGLFGGAETHISITHFVHKIVN